MGKTGYFTTSILILGLLFESNSLAQRPKVDVANNFLSLNLQPACEKQILNTLSKLEVPIAWFELPIKNRSSGFKTFKSKTNNPNVKFEFSAFRNYSKLSREDGMKKIGYVFDSKKNCIPKLLISNINPVANSFDDFNFKDVLDHAEKNNNSVLFYVWSPLMNLSMRGVSELNKIVQGKKIKLVGLVDPSANKDLISQIVAKNSWPTDFSRKLNSSVLESQNMLIHFPSLLIWKAGKYEVFRPGYDSPTKVTSLLQPYLK